MTRPRVAVVTTMPRVEQIDLFDEIARSGEIDLRVYYLQKLAAGRRWSHEPVFAHDAVLVPELRIRRQIYLNPGLLARLRRHPVDLSVITGYYAPALQAAMYRETIGRRPWVFWGELAGTRYAEQPVVRNEGVRDALRAIALFPVRHFCREIWAIGSRAQRDYERKSGGRIPVRNLPYFSNLDRFVAAGDRRRPSARLRFLFCNSLIERKGFDAVCEALATLVGEGRDIELHVAGAGPMHRLIEELAPEVRGHVIDHGFLELDAVPDVYAGADVLLYPSRHDGWGMGVVEGMAAAMPVISTPACGAAVDLIEDGISGVMIDRVDGGALAAAMRALIDQPGRIEPVGRAAREVARRQDHRHGGRRFIDAVRAAIALRTSP